MENNGCKIPAVTNINGQEKHDEVENLPPLKS